MDIQPPATPPSLDCLTLMSIANKGGASEALSYIALYAERTRARMTRLSLTPKGLTSVGIAFDLDLARGEGLDLPVSDRDGVGEGRKPPLDVA